MASFLNSPKMRSIAVQSKSDAVEMKGDPLWWWLLSAWSVGTWNQAALVL